MFFRYLFGLVVKQASQLPFREFYPSWRWPSPADRCCLLQLLDELEGRQAGGGKVVDYHSCELFPERWFDAVFVLRTDTKHLFDRLKARYSFLFSTLTCNVMKPLLRIISVGNSFKMLCRSEKSMENLSCYFPFLFVLYWFIILL